MKFIINETGEERELHYTRPVISEDMADDLIGISGAVGDYIKSVPGGNCYSISLEEYKWWMDYLEMAGRWEDQLDELREKYGADAVTDVIARSGLELGTDYTQHAREYEGLVQAAREILEAEHKA